jgi:peptide/nickel transport system permease protein
VDADKRPQRADAKLAVSRRILQRLLLSVLALLIGTVLIFAAAEALPGDAATAVLGQSATAETLAAMRAELGVDEPFPARYADWLGQLVRGDLGDSVTAKRPTWELIEPRLVNSLLLAGFAILLTVPLAVVLGLVTGLKRGTWLDGSVSITALVVLSLPEFVFGIFLAAFFGVFLGVLPATSLFSADESLFEHLRQVILPALAAGGVTAGYILRMTRISTIAVLDSDYVRAARLRGVRTMPLLFDHVLRNALVPVVNVIGSNVAWMFGGLVIIETVFAFPGIGSLLVQATASQDAPLIAALAIIITTAYIVINLLADLAVMALDPRLRSAPA